MDDNKLVVLRDIGYEIKPSCGSCRFADLNGEFGTCRLFKYDHLKHSGEARQLSIRRDGSCDALQVDVGLDFGSWNDFDRKASMSEDKLSDDEVVEWARLRLQQFSDKDRIRREVWDKEVCSIRELVAKDVAKMTKVQMVEYAKTRTVYPYELDTCRAGAFREKIVRELPYKMAPTLVEPTPWLSCAVAGLNELDELAALRRRLSDGFALYAEGRLEIRRLARMVKGVEEAEFLAENWVYVFHNWKRLGEFVPAALFVRNYVLRHAYFEDAEASALFTFARSISWHIGEQS